MRTTFQSVEEWQVGPYARVCEAANCHSQIGVANFLGIRQSSISDAKKRKAVPPEWLLTIWEKTGISPEWILTGQGYKYLAPTEHIAKQLTVDAPADNLALCHSCPLESKFQELLGIMATCTDIKSKVGRSKPGSCIVWYEDGKPLSLYSATKNEEEPQITADTPFE